MLRCGRCGSTRFQFTTSAGNKHEQHGAVCAVCRKRLNAQDTCAHSAESAKAWSARGTACDYTSKPSQG